MVLAKQTSSALNNPVTSKPLKALTLILQRCLDFFS